MKPLLPLLFFLGVCAACREGTENPPVEEAEGAPAIQDPLDGQQQAQIARLIASEDLILDLSSSLKSLATWLSSSCTSEKPLPMPAELGALRRSAPLASADLGDLLQSAPEGGIHQRVSWPLSEVPLDVQAPENPWLPLAGLFGEVTAAKFGVLSGKFLDETRFELKTSFSARAVRDDRPFGLVGAQTLVWEKSGESWLIAEWGQESMDLVTSPRTLFEDTLEEALPDGAAFDRATRSYHDELLVQYIKTGTVDVPDQRITPHFPIDSSYCFPSVSVVDYDGDSWDDLFLTARWGPTQLLRNKGDGTFEDVSFRTGLRESFGVNCASFADFDNDGDQDAVLGFSILPSKYYRNDGGRFEEVTGSSLASLSMISGIAVSDVNRDGLLDLYLSTYRPEEMEEGQWLNKFLTAEERAGVKKLLPDHNRWTNSIGPPNVLLLNRGDHKFERAPLDGPWSQWRDSFQAVWADYDADGDDDLYVCNDFSPDALLRNDTPRGAKAPVFTDATVEVFGKTSMAFGMGADWGDYDRDGDLDLYVSNMYSKAGKRIFAQLDGAISPQIEAAAAGNFLYENREGKLVQVAGHEAGQQHVDHVGWSYGGQFADFDNDGHLDLYVPSGYYSPPKVVASEVDL
jgi:hypothetical protein